jgi:sigma-B regulation protein RsbU (phosphoserine phosphatase)
VRPLSNGRLLIFNIDVSGHGVPAALNSFALHSRLSQLRPQEPHDLPNVAAMLNEELLSQEGDAYVTTVFGLVEGDGSKAWLIRAGHPMPILMRRALAQFSSSRAAFRLVCSPTCGTRSAKWI